MVRIQLYKWVADSSVAPLGVVYSDVGARDRLIARMTRVLGEMCAFGPSADLSVVKVERVRVGWERSAREQGAVLALGLSAL